VQIGVGVVLVLKVVALCCVVLHGRLVEPAIHAPIYVCECVCVCYNAVVTCKLFVLCCSVLPCVAVSGSRLLLRLQHTAKH